MKRSSPNRASLEGIEDEELVAIAVSTGDPSVFAILVERHQSRIRNWLRQLTGSAALADDLAQDAFIQAWRRLESFKGSGRFSGWISRIAYRSFLRARHARAREQEVAAAHHNERELVHAQQSEARQNEAWAELHKLLSLLNENERLAMVLSYAHGFSHGEIAEITGMPVGTVKTHIRRGKTKIGKEIEDGDAGGRNG